MRDAKAVVKELDVARNTAVKASWGEPLDEMEALAYLLGDAMGHMLLPEEARKLGREEERQLKAAKDRSERLRCNTAARRSKATKAAAKDPEKAAALDERLRDIEQDFSRQCAEMWGQPAKPLDWPPVRSKVVDGPAPIHWRARAQVESSDDDDEFAPETVEEAAEAAEIAEAKARVAHATAEAAALKAARASRCPFPPPPTSPPRSPSFAHFLEGVGLSVNAAV